MDGCLNFAKNLVIYADLCTYTLNELNNFYNKHLPCYEYSYFSLLLFINRGIKT